MLQRGSLRHHLVGDRAFLKTVLQVAVPVLIQNTVTNLVSLLDNIMVGQLGTAQMSGVAIANQLAFIVYLCIFGGLGGPAIFGAQYYGAGDMPGLRNTFRLKIWVALGVWVLALAVFGLWWRQLVALFLTGQGEAAQAQGMLAAAGDYLGVIIPGVLPFALTQCYAGTLREAGETMLPMKAGIAAVLTNLGFNWVLIYGHLGFPALGVTGAAIATVISRFVEVGIILWGIHASARLKFMHGVWRTLKVPLALVKKVVRKGLPLLVNEFLWSLGMAAIMQIYSLRSLDVLPGLNIHSAVANMFNVFFLSVGYAVSVLAGQTLGAGQLAQARLNVRRMIFLGFVLCTLVGLAMGLLSGLFPQLYNTSAQAQRLAQAFIVISAVLMPFVSVTHSSYFTLRAGGSVLVTFLFDSVFTWGFAIPFTYALVKYTALDMVGVFALSQGTTVLKGAIGLWLVHRGKWARRIVHTADGV